MTASPPPPPPSAGAPIPPEPSDQPNSQNDSPRPGFQWRTGQVARAAITVIGIWLGLLLLWSANLLVFVVFLGVLFGVAVARGVDGMEKFGIRRGVASALLVFGTVGILGLSFALIFPTLSAQAGEIRRQLPEALDKVQSFVNKREFGFLDPFLRAPDDSTQIDSSDFTVDSVAAAAIADSIRTRPAPRPRPQPALPPLADSSALAAMEKISQAIDDTLRTRSPRARAPDSGLFEPAAPFRNARADSAQPDSSITPVGVIGETGEQSRSAAIVAQIEARSQFLRDSLRGVMQRNIAEAERKAREEILSSPAVVGPREPTRSELLTRRLSSGLAGSSRQLFSIVTGTAAALSGLVLVMFLAIFIGAEPLVYRNWMLAVVPAEHRAHVRVVLVGMANTLRKWLVTQLVSMSVIGVVSTVVLLLLDVRAAFALGLIAGLLAFIPTVGPVLAAIPAIAMGFVDSPQKALFVLLSYLGIQFLENNLLVPALMRGELDLPPAITLVAQALMAVLFGFIGLMVAVPLTAAILVPLRMMAATQDARERALLRQEADEMAAEATA